MVPVVMAVACLLPSLALSAALPVPEWVGIYNVQGKAGLLWIKDPAIVQYKVFRRRTDEKSFTLLAQVAGNRYNDESIQPRIDYFYRLVGVTRTGEETPPSQEAAFTLTPKVRAAISPPRWEGSVVMQKGLGFKWEYLDPSLVVAYNVYRKALPEGRWELLASTRENAFTDLRVTDGQDYSYRVTAIDANFSETPPSAELTLTYKRVEPTVTEKAPAYVWTPLATQAVKVITGTSRAPLRSPTDVALAPGQDFFYVADSGNGVIAVFSREGNFRYDFPVAPPSPPPPPRPAPTRWGSPPTPRGACTPPTRRAAGCWSSATGAS